MGLDRNEIADQLRERIVTGKYAVDTKLPGYRQLAELFGAAPNTVGEAVHILAAEGLVTTRPGASAVVRSPDAGAAALPADAVRAELADLRTEIHRLRGSLGNVEKRVSDLLTSLDGS